MVACVSEYAPGIFATSNDTLPPSSGVILFTDVTVPATPPVAVITLSSDILIPVPAVYFVSVALMTFVALIATLAPAVYLVSVALIVLSVMVILSPAVSLSCLLPTMVSREDTAFFVNVYVALAVGISVSVELADTDVAILLITPDAPTVILGTST